MNCISILLYNIVNSKEILSQINRKIISRKLHMESSRNMMSRKSYIFTAEPKFDISNISFIVTFKDMIY